MNKHQEAGAARNLAGQIEQEAGEALGRPRLRVSGLYEQAMGAAEQRYGDALEGVREAMDRTERFAGQHYAEGRRKVENGARALNARVETNPVMAVLVAGMIGYALGMLTDITRRR